MKKLIILVFVLMSIACSNNSEEVAISTPEYYDIKYEIIGNGKAAKIRYSDNDGYTELEYNSGSENPYELGVPLPFVKEVRIMTEEDGHLNSDGTKSYGCKTISISAYLDRNDCNVTAINIYANGKLVASEDSSQGYFYTPGETWTPWGVHFEYLRRGSDPSKYKCNN